MKNHEHEFLFTNEVDTKTNPPLYKYVCKCGDSKWLRSAEERVTSRSPIGAMIMEETTSPAVDPKKEAQRAKQTEYRKKRYQMKKAGTWNGHMPKP